ncbi:hypothetical protein AcW1_009924 [Taiwanofungus camphoratus]|nr:hypothetical protein AcV5_003240 [Antrodia cinnamomea]KAI0946472.1 hypothetical protein AcW1_009924 [Antrodia cinnamomea]
MISLNPGSLCDVCAEEYGPHNYPHSIPCGHILCLSCCNNILQKTSPRLTPSCPFCRVQFTSDNIRLIRVDFGSSGWSTPRRGTIEAYDTAGDGVNDDDVLLLNPGILKTRAEARRLEYKVAKVAAKKCSVEEVTTLHKELQQWLTSDDKRDDQSSALQLSAALLRAILVNHVAHSEASKIAKAVEANLKEKLQEVETAKSQVEAELRKLRGQYSAKTQECQTLRTELNRLKPPNAASPGFSAMPSPNSTSASALASPPRPQSTASFPSPRSGATSPTSPSRTSYTPSVQSPLSRISAASGHLRSASTIPSHRSMTPAARPASAIPTPSHGPQPGVEVSRTYIPHRQQRVSSPPPPLKMTRSTSSGSDEKEKEKQREKDRQRVQLIQRWLPNLDSDDASVHPTGKFLSPLGAATTTSATTLASMPPPRFKTPLSVHSP